MGPRPLRALALVVIGTGASFANGLPHWVGPAGRVALVAGIALLLFDSLRWIVQRLRVGAVLTTPKVDKNTISTAGPDMSQVIVEYTSLLVANKRESGGESATAYDVIATIEAFDEGGKPFETSATTAHGRWIPVNEMPTWVIDPNPARRVTLEPTREEARLLVLMTYFESDDPAHAGKCFLARDTYFETLGWPGFGPGKWKLVVTLRGRNLRRPARFEFDVFKEQSIGRVAVTPRKPWWRRWKD